MRPDILSNPLSLRTSSIVSRVVLAWVPFFILWALFILSYVDGDVGSALLSALINTSLAALLGMGVWWISGLYPWPERVRPLFYLTHLALATIYALLWTASSVAAGAVVHNHSFVAFFSESSGLGWRMLMGTWLYGVVAGISYALRTRHKLREQERVAARAEALAVQAQLRALRAQLNPHFLFNALHSVATLIRHDPPRAEQAVQRLGDLLRYVLDEDESEVLLADEWAFTQAYLALERLRLGDRLYVEPRFAEETLACPVPPFALQTLVENAVQHGVAPQATGGHLFIEARLTEDRLYLVVRDDGPGTAPDTSPSPGHGLRILQERLAALHGEAGRLTVEAAPGEGFTATITLPAPSRGIPSDLHRTHQPPRPASLA